MFKDELESFLAENRVVHSAVKQRTHFSEHSGISGRVFVFDTLTSTMDIAREILTNISLSEEVDAAASSVISGEGSSSFLVISREQTSGRGTKGRVWASPAAGGVYLSAAWEIPYPIWQLQGISLAAGVMIRDYLESLRVKVQLKWPNDVIARKAGGGWGKLSGLLFETVPVAREDHTGIILGLGFNVDQLPNTEIPAVSLTELAQLGVADKNEIYLQLSLDLLRETDNFMRCVSSGHLHDYLARWHEGAWGYGDLTTINTGREKKTGVLKGISKHGALLLESESGELEIISGELEFSYVAGD
ncbi:MAG: biotin--[acetyl-CoA-carboxylase] ligase [bacterium]|nr:biotin--[acetyl-CoA-carboxylase] ligase [bacterium]